MDIFEIESDEFYCVKCDSLLEEFYEHLQACYN